MATPQQPFSVVLVNPDGSLRHNTVKFFPTAQDARDGVRDMLRAAPLGTEAWVYKTLGSVSLNVSFDWTPEP